MSTAQRTHGGHGSHRGVVSTLGSVMDGGYCPQIHAPAHTSESPLESLHLLSEMTAGEDAVSARQHAGAAGELLVFAHSVCLLSIPGCLFEKLR